MYVLSIVFLASMTPIAIYIFKELMYLVYGVRGVLLINDVYVLVPTNLNTLVILMRSKCVGMWEEFDFLLN